MDSALGWDKTARALGRRGWQECEAMRWGMGPMSLLSPRIAGSRWPETAALD